MRVSSWGGHLSGGRKERQVGGGGWGVSPEEQTQSLKDKGRRFQAKRGLEVKRLWCL